jgi:REP element-mobilizing transposase RayT
LPVHFVFSTKERVRLIVPDMLGRLFEYMGGICRGKRCSLIAANAVPDHMHMLVQVHPSVGVSDLMREVKSRSSSFIREAFADCEWPGWQNGYGGFAVSSSAIESVKVYIARQEEHHRRMSFQEEFVALLDRHGIEYDPKYLWD